MKFKILPPLQGLQSYVSDQPWVSLAADAAALTHV